MTAPLSTPDQPTIRLFDGYNGKRASVRPLVLRLQKLLVAKGFAVTLDGLFGRSTDEAVDAFQTSRGIEADGVVGPQTWRALLDVDPTTAPSFATTYTDEHPSLRRDLIWAEKHRALIDELAKEFNRPPALVAAIGSRESGWGRILTPPCDAGTGDHGHGRGLMQIDDRSHEFARSGAWRDARANMQYGLALLGAYERDLASSTALKGEACLRAALAGYNCGLRRVKQALAKGQNVDYYTTGRDYSRDVFNRAGWFERRGW